MRLLLDTCTFLWIILGADALSKRARELHEDPSNEVYLSSVSAWEISVKFALGRLPLPEDPDRFIPEQRRLHGIDPLPLDETAALQLPRLPDLHRDPFDRMLVCQSIVEGLTLLTPDRAIIQYPVRTIW
ncbi:MAG: type II toxin-antitoxin system VapC family toxin [Acidobacteriota bacterium]